jgi:hypothetical protein
MNSLRRYAKVAGLLVGGLLAVLVIAFGVCLLINVRDEPLNPHARAVLDARHDSVQPRDNIYFAILGMNFQGDTDLNELGRKVYARYLEQSHANPGKLLSMYDDAPFKRDAVVGDESPLCGRSRRQEDCIERAAAHPDELQRLVEWNRELVDRYASLQKYTQLENPVPLTVSSPVLDWRIFLSAKRLWLTEVALEAGRGQVDDALDALQRDFAFTRQLLASADILLIDKVVLATSTRMDLMVISNLARSGNLGDAQYSRLAKVVTPLTESERSLVTVLAREFTAYVYLFEPLVNGKDAARLAGSGIPKGWLRSLADDISLEFIKYNATMNMAWSYVEMNQAASQGSCMDLAENIAKLAQLKPRPIIGYVYNPIGKILVQISAPGGDEYLKSLCDLQGMDGIVALQLAARVEHVPDAGIADFVKRSTHDYANPYTGKPFDWNERDGGISFEPAARRNAGYFPWPITVRGQKDRT